MTGSNGDYETPKARTLWLMLGFALLVAVGVVTVLLPELEDEPAEESASSQTEEQTAPADESDGSGSR